MPTQVETGPCRIVWGNPARSQVKKHQGEGPLKGTPVLRDGKEVTQWTFGVAIPKEHFTNVIWPAMAAEIATGYPNGAPPRFAYKYQDGDGIDSHGKPFSEREGYAGHYVLTISTEAFAPPIFKWNAGTNKYDQLTPEQIKTGDWVNVPLNLKVYVATGTNTPSIYVNPELVEFIGYGTEIVSAGVVDPMQRLGGRVHALPAGASATPIGGAPAGMAPPSPGGMPPITAPPPPPAPVAAAPARPVDPSHIAPDGKGGELWWNGAAWVPGVAAQPAPPPPPPVAPAGMAPPAPGFVAGAVGGMPPMPGAAPMPGMMPGR